MLQFLLLCAAAGVASSTVYSLLVAIAAHRFCRRPGASAATPPVHWPPVSVLKPLHGGEPRLEECLDSFFNQRYTGFEIVFAARHAADAAWPVVHRLKERYPEVRTISLQTGEPQYAN